MRFLSSLCYSNVWLAPIQQPKPIQNIIILDWDDTLLPTSAFLRQENQIDFPALAEKNKKILVAIQK